MSPGEVIGYHLGVSLADFPNQPRVVQLLQRSLDRQRLAHAYLFAGQNLAELEAVAATVAKVLNCRERGRGPEPGRATDCCDHCASCKKIDAYKHSDVRWLRPESKLRVITIDTMRELMESVHLKPNEAEFKVAVVVSADRLNIQAANAFLKTLEEPPARSVLILLSTEPQRVLATIVSRCLRLDFAREGVLRLDENQTSWLEMFSATAAAGGSGLLERYRLLGLLLRRLVEMKSEIEKTLSARSPLEGLEEVDAEVRDRWEDELSAAIEAEYRRQRAELLAALHWWLRDVWLHTLSISSNLFSLPQLQEGTRAVAQRLSREQAGMNLRLMNQIQRSLHTNVQESLALEVGFLKLGL